MRGLLRTGPARAPGIAARIRPDSLRAFPRNPCALCSGIRIYTVIDLVNQLLEAREDRVLQRMRRRLDQYHLIVLDEFGYVPFSKAGAELLFDVVSRAYERQSLILTSNLPFEQWTEILGNERLTGALLDRLTHRVHILEANGESYRLNDVKKRTRKQQREDPEKPPSPRGGETGDNTP